MGLQYFEVRSVIVVLHYTVTSGLQFNELGGTLILVLQYCYLRWDCSTLRWDCTSLYSTVHYSGRNLNPSPAVLYPQVGLQYTEVKRTLIKVLQYTQVGLQYCTLQTTEGGP